MVTLSSLQLKTPKPPARFTGIPSLHTRKFIDTVKFQSQPKVEDHIDDDIYDDVLIGLDKFLLHEHQSGGSYLAFLKYALMGKTLGPTGEIDSQKFKELDLTTLDWNELCRYFRVDPLNERLKQYIKAYNETGQEPTFIQLTEEEKATLKKIGLSSYRAVSGLRINPLVKNPPAAYLLAHLFALDTVLENTRYIEYRVSPLSFENISPETILNQVKEGFLDAQIRLDQYSKTFDFGLIALFERHGIKRPRQNPTTGEIFTPDPNEVNPLTGQKYKIEDCIALAHEIIRLRKQGFPLVGVDLAGDELNYPVTDFEPVFKIIKDYNKTAPEHLRLGITIHAGETHTSGPLTGWESIDKAIEIASGENTKVRIGHGLQIMQSSKALQEAFEVFKKDPNHWEQDFHYPKDQYKSAIDYLLASSPTLKKIVERGIVLEMCPKSNIQTYAVVGGDEDNHHAYKNHPGVFLSRLGVKIAVSSDNRLITNTTITNELVKLYKHMGANYDDIKKMILDSAEGAFIFDPVKREAFLQQVKDRFKQIEHSPGRIVGLYKLRHNGQAPSLWVHRGLKLWCSLYHIGQEIKNWLLAPNFRQEVKALFKELWEGFQSFLRPKAGSEPHPEDLHTPNSV